MSKSPGQFRRFDFSPEVIRLVVLMYVRYSRNILVGSPDFLAGVGPLSTPEQIAALPTLTLIENIHSNEWRLSGPDNRIVTVHYKPQIACSDSEIIRKVAIAGLGIPYLRQLKTS